MLKASTVAGLAAAVFATGVPLEIDALLRRSCQCSSSVGPELCECRRRRFPGRRFRSRRIPHQSGLRQHRRLRVRLQRPRFRRSSRHDHPLKRFFRQFGEQGPNGPQGGPNRRSWPAGWEGPPAPSRAGLRLLHLRGRLCRHQGSRRFRRLGLRCRHDRRDRVRRQADREGSARTDLAVLKRRRKGSCKFSYVNWADDNDVRVWRPGSRLAGQSVRSRRHG